jgi:two-component system, cell cycle response regulator CpdR
VDLIDVSMPVMSGIDLVQKARQLRPGLPVVFITGLADLSLQQTLPENTAYIQKPFALASLASKVRSLLDHSSFIPAVAAH